MARTSLEQMEGAVEAVARSGKALKIGDDWFNAMKTDQMEGVKAGDVVAFEYELKKVGGQEFRNIKGEVEVVEEGEERPQRRSSGGGSSSRSNYSRGDSGRTSSRSSGSGRGGSGGDSVQRMIVRQNSLTQANAMFATLAAAGQLGASSPEDLADEILAIAKVFEAFSMLEDVSE